MTPVVYIFVALLCSDYKGQERCLQTPAIAFADGFESCVAFRTKMLNDAVDAATMRPTNDGLPYCRPQNGFVRVKK